MMLVSQNYYYGTPPALIPSLEAIAQATVDEYFRLAELVYADKEIDVWNCSVYRSVVTENNTKFKRLRIVNHSCGYWAILQWGSPEAVGYEGRFDFWVYAADTKQENPTKVDWKAFKHDWAYGKCALFWQASKESLTEVEEDKSWYAPVHALDFKFSFLHTLTQAGATK
jgi:hypothetical protein